MKIKFGRDPIFRRIILIDRWESILNLLDYARKQMFFVGEGVGITQIFIGAHAKFEKFWELEGGSDDI